MHSVNKRNILLLVLSLISLPAAATITDVDPNDKSLEYLRYIFGDVVNIIIGEDGPAQPDSVLGAMSEILNIGMLVFTGVIFSYVSVTGLLNSAQDGVFLGKKYSSVWVPARTIGAFGIVLPFAGGYSVMQMGVLWVAGLGIGLANSVWHKALDHVKATGTLYPPAIVMDYEGIAKGILESRVCMHGINQADRHVNIIDKPMERVSAYLSDFNNELNTNPDTDFSKTTPHKLVKQNFDSRYTSLSKVYNNIKDFWSGFDVNENRINYGSNPCGSISLKFAEMDYSTRLEVPIQKFHHNVVQATASLDSKIDPIAISIVRKTLDTDGSAPNPDLAALKAAIDTFKNEFKAAVNEAMSDIASARLNKWADGNPDVAGYSNGAREIGWISAGAWYWDFQMINKETRQLVTISPQIDRPTQKALKHQDYQTFQAGLDEYLSNMQVQDQYGNTVSAMERSSYSEENHIFEKYIVGILRSSMSLIFENPDPVSSLANLGHSMIIAIELGWAASFAVDTAALAAQETAKSTPLGFPLVGPLTIAKQVTGQFLTFIVIAALFMFPIVAMLAYYLPTTPFILWVMGIAGWFVLLIEAVIAAPIWAASHAMPEGDGIVGTRAMAGYMVLLSLFLRPTLMLFGFFSSMVLMIVMCKVITLMFIPMISSIMGDTLSGVVTTLAFLTILAGVVIQIAHRAYGLINEVPDKVLRYIGGGAENLGEASNEQASRKIFVGGVSGGYDAFKKSMPKSDGVTSPSGSKNNGLQNSSTPDPQKHDTQKGLNRSLSPT